MCPSVLVAVINYNAVEDTIKTLKCLLKQKYTNYEIIILDNASTNDCAERILKVFPEITVERNDKNNGYSGAINDVLKIGVKKNYDTVIICNNDIIVDEDTVGKLMLTAMQCDNVGIVGGIEIDYYTNKIKTVGGTGYSLWTSRAIWSKYLSDSDGRSTPIKVNFVQGSIILFSSKVINLDSLVDENLFMYGEEADIGFKLKGLGLSAYVNPDVRVYHKSEQRYLKPINGYYQQRNRLYLATKYGKWYQIIFYFGYSIILELPVKVIIRTLTGHRDYAWACIQGFWDGVRGKMGDYGD